MLWMLAIITVCLWWWHFLLLPHFAQKNVCFECIGSNFISHRNNQGVWLIWWHELCFGKMIKLWFDHLNNICKEYKFWDISLFNFHKPPLFSFLLHPNIFLSTPFLNTFWYCFSLNVKYWVSHPCKTIEKFSFIYILIYMFWLTDGKTKDNKTNGNKFFSDLICS